VRSTACVLSEIMNKIGSMTLDELVGEFEITFKIEKKNG